ncbi:TIGR01777 family oxidoreductase [Brumimicrobium sp.]|uniref:TIGR01777 family oxidoreductase n=1 Tax=Brumimicrobium sp. TaxID=2029867 RepID=UPI003A93F263
MEKKVSKRIVLIAGGSGLIGQEVQKELKKSGHEVRILTRQENPEAPYFHWDPKNKEIDRAAIKGVQVIINLVGVGIADKRWSDKRKEAIFNSRIKPTQFLHEISQNTPALVQYISASGITCYGYEDPIKIYKESDDFGTDFLSTVVRRWEEVADLFSPQQKVVKVRTGVVLTEKGGALPKISGTIKNYIGAPLGSGEQKMPWITLKDIARIYVHAVNSQLDGVFNASSANISNEKLTKAVASYLKKPLWLPNVPGFVLKTVLGEMSSLVLEGVRIDNSKILNTGFEFQHKTIDEALDYIYVQKEKD